MGHLAENIALAYLQDRGLVLRDRNWHAKHLELDLVMENEKELHVVEVRSRRFPMLVAPLDSVRKKKQRNVIKAGSLYVYRNKINKEVVFDIVSIVFHDDRYDLEYVERAFLPMF